MGPDLTLACLLGGSAALFSPILAHLVFADIGALIEEDDVRRDAPASLCRLTPCTADEKTQIKFMELAPMRHPSGLGLLLVAWIWI